MNENTAAKVSKVRGKRAASDNCPVDIRCCRGIRIGRHEQVTSHQDQAEVIEPITDIDRQVSLHDQHALTTWGSPANGGHTQGEVPWGDMHGRCTRGGNRCNRATAPVRDSWCYSQRRVRTTIGNWCAPRYWGHPSSGHVNFRCAALQ